MCRSIRAKCSKGSLFVAVKGYAADGHRFITKAIEQGAVVIVCQDMPTQQEGVTYVQTADSSEAAGQIAHNFL
jgi:UDP-N-acetylmuramoyl-L-alanyl-D-glutamate--2,6-diaminopimelate ligase